MSLFDNWVRNAGQYPSQASSAKPVNAASIWGAERVEDQRYTKGHGSAHLVGGQRARPSLFAEAGRTVSTRPLDVCLSATSSSCSTRSNVSTSSSIVSSCGSSCSSTVEDRSFLPFSTSYGSAYCSAFEPSQVVPGARCRQQMLDERKAELKDAGRGAWEKRIDRAHARDRRLKDRILRTKARHNFEVDCHEVYRSMLEAKNTPRLPDRSFDLDADGIVSARDYAIASAFDVDGDGKLNDHELANAKTAVANGALDSYRGTLANLLGLPLYPAGSSVTTSHT